MNCIRKTRQGNWQRNSFCLLFAMKDGLKVRNCTTPLGDDVHVWRIALDHIATSVAMNGMLSADERQRADRFRFNKDRVQFIQSRAALRFILGNYLSIAPNKVEFSYSTYGKPSLANGSSPSTLQFNLSRRDNLALLAIANNREVGVDVEITRNDLPLAQMAETSFSQPELTTWRNLPPNLRTLGFFNCWTRKEAYIKAHGEGLSFPLKQFDVSLVPGMPARLIEVRNGMDDAGRWTMNDVPAGDGYVAAIAATRTGPAPLIRGYDLDTSVLGLS
jgi:4'-phosphopantetheinyl transferase